MTVKQQIKVADRIREELEQQAIESAKQALEESKVEIEIIPLVETSKKIRKRKSSFSLI